MRRIFLFTFSVLAALGVIGPSLGAQQGQPASQPAPATPAPPATAPSQSISTIIQRVLVKVNGQIFTQKDLEEKQIEALQAQQKNDLKGEELTKAVTELMPDLLVNAVDEMLIIERGKELGYHMGDDEFKSMVERIKADNKMNDADFKAALGQEGLTLDALRARLDRSYIVQNVQRKEILGHLNLTEEEAHQYYDKHPDEFMKPPAVTLREILVAVAAPDARSAPAGRGGQSMFGASPNPAVADAAAKEKAGALRERAATGEDFEKLVREASDSPSKATGGLIGPINISEMSTGIRDAIDKMKPGEVTQPIRTTRGYQLYKLETRTTAERMPFDAVRDEIAQKIGESRLETETEKYVQTLRTQAYIDWKRADLHQMYDKRLAERAKQ